MKCLHTGKLPFKARYNEDMTPKSIAKCPECKRELKFGPNGSLPAHHTKESFERDLLDKIQLNETFAFLKLPDIKSRHKKALFRKILADVDMPSLDKERLIRSMSMRKFS